MTKLNEALKEHGYENAMHFVCDILCEQFESSDADNYIEMTFADKEDKNKSYTLTMQKTSGITPCQKVDALTERNKQLVENFQVLIHEMKQELVRGSYAVDTESGSSMVISIPALNSEISKITRALIDDDYMNSILATHKEQICQ